MYTIRGEQANYMVKRSKMRVSKCLSAKVLQRLVLSFLLGVYCTFCIKVFYRHSELGSSVCNGVGVWPTNIVSPVQSSKPHKALLLVGVMSANKYLATRAQAISDTWAHTVPGKLLFFLSNNTDYKGKLPIQSLENVSDNAYPPQRKSFEMLKYMHGHYIDKYEWFLRADDDVYVKGNKLEKFLRGLDSRKTLYVGQPGKGIQREQGKLGLRHGGYYCIGGVGVLFSGTALRKLVGHLNGCMKHVSTSHEDTELGRCVQNHVGVNCTTAYEMSKLFYQNFKERNGSFTHELGHNELNAITLHPLKQHHHVYRLHNFFLQHRLSELREKVVHLQQYVNSIVTDSGSAHQSRKRKSNYVKNDDFTYWDSIEKEYLYSTTENHRIAPRRLADRYNGTDIKEAIASGRQSLINLEDDYHSAIFVYGYIRMIPLLGTKYNIHYQLEAKGGNLPRLRTSVAHERPFRSLEFYEESDVRSDMNNFSQEHISIILPVYGRSEVFKKFTKRFLDIAHEDKYVSLIVVLFHDKGSHFNKSLSFYNHLKSKVVTVFTGKGPYSRMSAIEQGVAMAPNQIIILALDMDIYFSADFLHRTRMNTIRKEQAYLPIYFAYYDPQYYCITSSGCNENDPTFSSREGMWRYFNHGTMALYKSDYMRMNFLKNSNDNKNIYDIILLHNLTVFRAPDVGVVHSFQSQSCDSRLSPAKHKSCFTANLDMFGSKETLGRIVLKQTEIIDRQHNSSQVRLPDGNQMQHTK